MQRMRSWRTPLVLLSVALAWTWLNAVKPLTVDDPYYHRFALHILDHPFDPYGFQLADGRDAMHSLAPVMLSYWVAGAIRVLGDHPVLCKLSFFPLVGLLLFSLHSLARRFAPGLEKPVLAMVVVSPLFLPAWNLMLDLPTQALGLTALVLYLRGCERGSWCSILVAGLLAGLAMQTKYTALVLPAVLVWHGLVHRQQSYSLCAAGLALALFLSWEACLFGVYGESHFFYQLGQYSGGAWRMVHLLLPLVTTLGAVAPWLGLLALLVLGVRGWLFRAALVVLGGGYVLLALLPAYLPDRGGIVEKVWFGGWGLAVIATGLMVGVWSVRSLWKNGASSGLELTGVFLAGWLTLEVACYFALSPFPAARRVMGIVLVATFLVGRRAWLRWRTEPPRLLWTVVAISAFLGLNYTLVDFWEAHVRKQAAEKVVRLIRQHAPRGIIWCSATEGFAFYGERAGMTVVTTESVPQPGDWFVADRLHQAQVQRGLGGLRWWKQLYWTDPLPYRTLDCYYGTGTPLRYLQGSRYEITIWVLPGNPGVGRRLLPDTFVVPLSRNQ
jgi:hypothetical protein